MGRDLVGLKYEPLFNPADFDVAITRMGTPAKTRKRRSTSYPVITGDFVSMEDGTGIVHIAPAYGEVDYVAGQENGLDFVHMVDLQGKIIGKYPFAGKFVKEADPLVLDDLKSRGLLFRSETIRHTYPFCWRCEAPLLYYAKQTWYIQTTARKEHLLSGNAEVNWYPEHIKYGRFGDWLENNVDWAFSRERYWGTPLPVWRCQSCGEFDCVGGMGELKGKPGFSGLREPLDLHRPFVDDMTYNCPKCGGQMRRAPEVIDCWFDSGAMPIAQYHYPFENETLLEDGRFPADYICEAVDQTRGWFYSLHAISTLLFDRICYRNVICLGHILDAKGEKMSKSKGNVVWPWDIIRQYGADALRWYLYTAAPPGNPRGFDEKQVLEVTRRFLLTLWNVYSFFVTYANIDRFTPILSGTQFEPAELDHWILSELNQLIKDVDTALENYDPRGGAWQISGFVDSLSNWYVRRSRRRFWKSENDADKLSAYNTLYQCLVTLAKLMAPFTPFLADELYQNLVLTAFPDAPESVHLADFPVADESQIDQQLSADIQLAMRVASLGRAARAKAGIKVRQPIQTNVVGVTSEREKEILERVKPLVLEELNVKELKYDSFENVESLSKQGFVVVSEATTNSAIQVFIPENLKKEGMAREIVHRLQTMRRSAGFEIADHIVIYYQGGDYIRQVMTEFADYIRQETLAERLLEQAPEPGAFTESHKLGEHKVSLSVKRLD
jgi:isoleucyl-tRNA synthetase